MFKKPANPRKKLQFIAKDKLVQHIETEIRTWLGLDNPQKKPISEFLGLTEPEYATFITNPDEFSKKFVA